MEKAQEWMNYGLGARQGVWAKTDHRHPHLHYRFVVDQENYWRY